MLFAYIIKLQFPCLCGRTCMIVNIQDSNFILFFLRFELTQILIVIAEYHWVKKHLNQILNHINLPALPAVHLQLLNFGPWHLFLPHPLKDGDSDKQ